MGGVVKSGVYAHDLACALAEGVRQATVAGVTQNPAGQVASNNAEITWARAVISSCKTNLGGQGMEPYINLLKSLGTGGT
jgi:hypothetical protein